MKLKIIFSLIRLPNLIIVALTQYLCRHMLLRAVIKENQLDFFLSEFNFFLLVLSTIFITAAGFIINDYFDIEVDIANGKSSKTNFIKSNKKKILWSHHILSALGLFIGFYISYVVGNINLTFIQFIAVTLLWFYSVSYKKNILIGNIVVAFLSALVIVIVCVYEFYAFKMGAHKIAFNNWFVLVIAGYTVFAFSFNLLREIVKDIEDIEGDTKAGLSTFPAKFGVNYSKILLSVFLLATIYLLITAEIWLYKHEFDNTFYYFAGLINILLVIFTYLFIKANTKKQFRRAQQIIKIIMLAGLLSMILIPRYADKLIN